MYLMLISEGKLEKNKLLLSDIGQSHVTDDNAQKWKRFIMQNNKSEALYRAFIIILYYKDIVRVRGVWC